MPPSWRSTRWGRGTRPDADPAPHPGRQQAVPHSPQGEGLGCSPRERNPHGTGQRGVFQLARGNQQRPTKAPATCLTPGRGCSTSPTRQTCYTSMPGAPMEKKKETWQDRPLSKRARHQADVISHGGGPDSQPEALPEPRQELPLMAMRKLRRLMPILTGETQTLASEALQDLCQWSMQFWGDVVFLVERGGPTVGDSQRTEHVAGGTLGPLPQPPVGALPHDPARPQAERALLQEPERRPLPGDATGPRPQPADGALRHLPEQPLPPGDARGPPLQPEEEQGEPAGVPGQKDPGQREVPETTTRGTRATLNYLDNDFNLFLVFHNETKTKGNLYYRRRRPNRRRQEKNDQQGGQKGDKGNHYPDKYYDLGDLNQELYHTNQHDLYYHRRRPKTYQQYPRRRTTGRRQKALTKAKLEGQRRHTTRRGTRRTAKPLQWSQTARTRRQCRGTRKRRSGPRRSRPE